MLPSRARWKHDCGLCMYLGQWLDFDMYVHESNSDNIPTAIARYGHAGADYSSIFVPHWIDEEIVDIPHLNVAVAMAIAYNTSRKMRHD